MAIRARAQKVKQRKVKKHGNLGKTRTKMSRTERLARLYLDNADREENAFEMAVTRNAFNTMHVASRQKERSRDTATTWIGAVRNDYNGLRNQLPRLVQAFDRLKVLVNTHLGKAKITFDHGSVETDPLRGMYILVGAEVSNLKEAPKSAYHSIYEAFSKRLNLPF